jgi:hypothetical protein
MPALAPIPGPSVPAERGRTDAALADVERELRKLGIEPDDLHRVPPPLPLPKSDPLPPPPRPRRWPWYLMQIAVAGAVIASGTTWKPEHQALSFPLGIFAALFVTVTIVGTREAIARLATRPVVLCAWLALIVAALAWCVYRLAATGLAPFADAVLVLAVVSTLAAYATIFFAWITGPLLFGLPLFSRASGDQLRESPGHH